MLHEVIIISLQGKLKLFDESGQVFLYGENKAVVDEDKSWQRIISNLNLAPQNLSVLVLYEKVTAELLNRIAKFFSGVNMLRLTDIKSLATCLYVLHGRKEFVFCGTVARFDKQGDLICKYTEDTAIDGLTILSFKKVFSQEEDLRSLKKQLWNAENKFKTLYKKTKK